MKDPFSIPNQLSDKESRDKKIIPFKRGEEWEEALMGTNDEEEIRTLQPIFNYAKIKWLYLILALVFTVLISRVFYLQVVSGSNYKQAAEENRFRTRIIRAPRGVIYDRQKNLLVKNIPSFDIIAIPADLPKDENKRKEIWSILKSKISLSQSELDKVLSDIDYTSYQPLLIKKGISRDQALILESQIYNLPGISLEKNPIREYPEAEIFSHILGYTGKISQEELRKHKNYLLNDYIGKAGLELYYENILRGKNGREQIEVSSIGKPVRILAKEEPEAGKNLILSINRDLQRKMYETLRDGMIKAGARRAAAIALNPQNGEILGMISLPSYDNNLFAKGISEEDYQRLNQDPDRPLFTRSISGTYPPGSTIKPVMAAAGLQEGIITKDTIINDTGVITVPHEYNPDIVYTFYGWNRGGLGPMNVFSALAKSSDIYFYILGGGQKSLGIKGLGTEKIAEYFKKFGMESKLGIDLPNEAEGLIPTPKWKEEFKKEMWYLGDTYHESIGQGYLLVTPLQDISWTAAIANGGTLYRPYLVKQIISPDGSIEDIPPKIIRSDFISSYNIDLVRQGMREAVISGSARALADLPVKVAGKTGTAETGKGTTHAWFTCFAPYNNPEIALVILVEEGGEGSETAVPIAKEILKWYFENK